MATVYVSTTGNDANSYAQAQVLATAWKNPLRADAAATANDTVSLEGGIFPSTDYTGAPDHYALLKPLIYNGGGDSTLTATSTTYVARISGSATAGQFTFTDATLNARLVSSYCFQVGLNDAGNYNFTAARVNFSNFKSRGIVQVSRRGTLICTDSVFTGGGANSGGALYAINSINNDLGAVASATFTATITRPNIDLSAPTDAVASGGINLASSTTRNSAVSLSVTGGSVRSVANAASLTRAISLQGSDSATVDGVYARAVSSNAAAESAGIYMIGRSASGTANNNAVKNCVVDYVCPAGHGIQLGASVGSNFMTGGEVSGNRVTGKFYPSNTPHLLTLGEGTTAAAFGNTLDTGYVGILASKTTTATISSNWAYNAYGSAFYAKGCTAATFTGNTAILNGINTQRNLGALSVDSQSGTNTTATTMSANTVIVITADCGAGKTINSLVNITVNQNCTFSGNTYIIPDNVPNSEVLFYVGGAEGGRSGATGYTIAQWITGTAGSVTAANGTGTISVSGEKVIRLPIDTIRKMIATQSNQITGKRITGRNI
jgi:hypothetical protein